MNIFPDTNTRAEAMWRIISQEVDFRKKRVIDLGCGHGEMLWRAYTAGATVMGVDKEIKFWPLHAELIPDVLCGEHDINSMISLDLLKGRSRFWGEYYEIAFCFSVLPYLYDVPATLQWMAKNFPLCLIEAQYDPEPYNVGVVSDTGMAQLLVNNGFKEVRPLGTTYVDIRKTTRTLWECKG